MSTENKAFKTNKNKVVATVIIVVGILFLIGLIVSRAYNLNAGQSEIGDVTIPQEEIILPQEESNIEHLEKKQLEDMQAKAPVDDSKNTQQQFKTLTVNEPSKSKNQLQVNEGNKTIHTSNNQSNSNEYYSESRSTQRQQKEPVTIESKQSKIEPQKVVETVPVQKQGSVFGTVFNQSSKQGKAGKKSDLVKSTIHSDQALGNGQSAIMRLTDNMTLNDGTLLPKNSVMYGQVTYSKDRVNVAVKRVITPDKREIPVTLEVYDNDYIKGIYYKTAIDEGVEKGKDESTSDILSDMNIGGPIQKGIKSVGKLASKTAKNASETIKNNRKLQLEEGYIIFVKDIKEFQPNK